MKKSVVYSALLLMLIGFSCQNLDKVDKPENFIEEDKMIEILTDIAFVKAAKGSYKKVFDIEKINPELYILEKHGVDSLVFAQNNKWYINQIEDYENIFNKVKKNIEASKIKFEKLKKEEDSLKKIEDSIRKLKKGLKNINELSSDMEEFEAIKEELMNVEMEETVKKRTKSLSPSGKKKQ